MKLSTHLKTFVLYHGPCVFVAKLIHGCVWVVECEGLVYNRPHHLAAGSVVARTL